MKRFKLTDVQVEAILNMRLRALRKLEEIEIRKEFDALKAEKKDLEALLKSDERQWKCVAYEIDEVQQDFRPEDRRSASAAPASPTRRRSTSRRCRRR